MALGRGRKRLRFAADAPRSRSALCRRERFSLIKTRLAQARIRHGVFSIEMPAVHPGLRQFYKIFRSALHDFQAFPTQERRCRCCRAQRSCPVATAGCSGQGLARHPGWSVQQGCAGTGAAALASGSAGLAVPGAAQSGACPGAAKAAGAAPTGTQGQCLAEHGAGSGLG